MNLKETDLKTLETDLLSNTWVGISQEYRYSDADYAASKIWENLNKMGATLKSIKGRYSAPFKLKISEYGIIPEEGTIKGTLNGKEFELTFERWLTLKVTLGSDGKNLPELYEIFKFEPKPVEKTKMRSLYEELKLEGYKWEDIGGLKEVKEQLQKYIEWPLKNPTLFKKLGVKQPKGILLYGPPGTGKTLLAKVLACESKASFISTSAKELTSMWYGEEEKRIGELFEVARENVPSIVFIDEIDGLFLSRGSNIHEATRRGLLQFCSELDGIRKLDGVIVLAATNRYEDIDSALLRSGRFDLHLEIPKPDLEARKEIFKIHTKNMPLSPSVNLDELAKRTEEKVGADIEKICNDAGFAAITRYLKEKGLSIDEVMAEKIDDLYILPEDFKVG